MIVYSIFPRLKVYVVEHGPIKLSTYLTNFRIGDIVDIKANAAQQKGMPHKYYHGCVLYHSGCIYVTDLGRTC